MAKPKPSNQEKKVSEEIKNVAAEQAATEQPPAETMAVEAPKDVQEPPVEQPNEESKTDSTEETNEEASEAPAEESQAPVTEEPAAVSMAEVEKPDVQQAPEAPAVAKEPEPEVAAAQEETSEEVKYLNAIEVNGTVNQKRILKALMNFIESMTPGRPAAPADLVKAQNLFLDHLLWALDREDPSEFKQLWSTLLVGFKAYHGEQNSPSKGYSSLSEYRAGVYSDFWTDEDRLAAYLNLISVLRHTRNLETRGADIKRIKLDSVSDVLVVDRRLENLKRFYSV